MSIPARVSIRNTEQINDRNKMNKKNKTTKLILNCAQNIALISAIFTLIVCTLMMANYFQVKTIDPLNSPAIQTLTEKLEETPQDQSLQKEIRALDLLARKAYFTSQWQLKTGAYLLLVGIVFLLASLKTIQLLNKKLPSPEKTDEDENWFVTVQSRKWIIGIGSFLLFFSLLVSILSYRNLNNYSFIKIAKKDSTKILKKTWPNFRGHGGNGIAMTDQAPISWDGETGENVLWKVETPLPGFSSPVIWENKLFITGATKKTQEVYCYNTLNGKLIWRQEVNNVPGTPKVKPRLFSDTGYAPNTMATDGKYICATFPTGDVICFDLDGNFIWSKNLGKPVNHYGHSSSLIIYKNLLIIQYDQKKNARLLALDVSSGKEVWRARRSVISWSSPICVNTGERMELILTNSTSIDSYDPQTGALLWNEDCLGGEMGPSAAYADGMVFGANDYATVAAVKITETGSEVVWKDDTNLPDTASPLATGRYLFLACSYGYLACVDALTGKTFWEKEYDYGFYSSPILVGNHVYALDMDGVMHIVESDSVYNLIAESKLGESSSATPAFIGDKIYVRGDKYLYCISE